MNFCRWLDLLLQAQVWALRGKKIILLFFSIVDFFLAMHEDIRKISKQGGIFLGKMPMYLLYRAWGIASFVGKKKRMLRSFRGMIYETMKKTFGICYARIWVNVLRNKGKNMFNYKLWRISFVFVKGVNVYVILFNFFFVHLIIQRLLKDWSISHWSWG